MENSLESNVVRKSSIHAFADGHPVGFGAHVNIGSKTESITLKTIHARHALVGASVVVYAVAQMAQVAQ